MGTKARPKITASLPKAQPVKVQKSLRSMFGPPPKTKFKRAKIPPKRTSAVRGMNNNNLFGRGRMSTARQGADVSNVDVRSDDVHALWADRVMPRKWEDIQLSPKNRACATQWVQQVRHQLRRSRKDNKIILLSGSTGVGKTSMMRLLTQTLLQQHGVRVRVTWMNTVFEECESALVAGQMTRDTKSGEMRQAKYAPRGPRIKDALCAMFKIDRGEPGSDYRRVFLMDAVDTLTSSDWRLFLTHALNNRARHKCGPIVCTALQPSSERVRRRFNGKGNSHNFTLQKPGRGEAMAVMRRCATTVGLEPRVLLPHIGKSEDEFADLRQIAVRLQWAHAMDKHYVAVDTGVGAGAGAGASHSFDMSSTYIDHTYGLFPATERLLASTTPQDMRRVCAAEIQDMLVPMLHENVDNLIRHGSSPAQVARAYDFVRELDVLCSSGKVAREAAQEMAVIFATEHAYRPEQHVDISFPFRMMKMMSFEHAPARRLKYMRQLVSTAGGELQRSYESAQTLKVQVAAMPESECQGRIFMGDSAMLHQPIQFRDGKRIRDDASAGTGADTGAGAKTGDADEAMQKRRQEEVVRVIRSSHATFQAEQSLRQRILVAQAKKG